MDCAAAGEKLPAPHNDIDISGAELETVADAACHFGRDQAGARAEKRMIAWPPTSGGIVTPHLQMDAATLSRSASL